MVTYNRSNRKKNTIDPGYKDWREPRTGEESHELWQHRIEQALEARKRHDNGEETWKRMYRLYAGDHWNEAQENKFLSSEYPRDRITVNKCMSIVNDNLAFIIQANPKFAGTPKRSEDVVSAKIQSEWLNALWDELELNLPISEALKDWLIIGQGVVKTGYQFESDDVVKSAKMDGTIVYNDFIQKERPYCYRVNPRQFLWDYGNSSKLEDSRWCCEIIFSPISDVFANESYSQKAINLVRTGMATPLTVASYSKSNDSAFKKYGQETDFEKDCDRFVKYEIWDKKYMERRLYLAGVCEPLIIDAWPYDYLVKDGDGFPYEVITYNDIPNEPFAQGIIQIFEDQQYEKNRTRTADFAHRRRFNRKYAVVDNGIEPEEIDKLQNGGDGTIIMVKSQGDVTPIQDAPLGNDHYNIESKIDNDIRELTGSDALLSGGRLPSRTSASEISARASVQTTKLSLAINKADKFVTNIGYKILSHSRANVTTQQAIQILGSLGQTWESFLATDLSSRFTLKLESSTSKPYDSDMDKQQRMNIFQMFTNLIPILQQAQVQVNIAEIFKWVLEPFNIKDISRFFPDASVIQPVLPWMNNASNANKSPNPQNMAAPQPQMPQDPQQQMIAQQGANGGGQMNSQMLGAMMGGGQ